MTVHIVDMEDPEWLAHGWLTVVYGECDGCGVGQLIGLFRGRPFDVRLKHGTLALESRLARAFGWEDGRCPLASCRQHQRPIDAFIGPVLPDGDADP